MRGNLDPVRGGEFRRAEAVLRSTTVPVRPGGHDGPPHAVFVTISRQAGAGGTSVARALVERLNELDPRPNPWTCWDQELVKKVAATSHVPERLIETLEENGAGWLLDVLSGLATSEEAARTDEFALVKVVSRAIYGLACAGRVVIVGRGGAFLTRPLPGGVHVRIVAPLEWRVAHMARLPDTTPAQAARRVEELDRRREAFYRRHWPGQSLRPDDFSATFNSAEVPVQVIAECAALLVNAKAESLAASARDPESRKGGLS
jgi:cytidylate kinase